MYTVHYTRYTQYTQYTHYTHYIHCTHYTLGTYHTIHSIHSINLSHPIHHPSRQVQDISAAETLHERALELDPTDIGVYCKLYIYN